MYLCFMIYQYGEETDQYNNIKNFLPVCKRAIIASKGLKVFSDKSLKILGTF